MKLLVVFLLIFSSCSTVQINCNYYRLKDKKLENVCVEEWPGRGPVYRETKR